MVMCELEYCVLLSLTILLLMTTITAQSEKAVKTAVFLSPKFVLQPGSVFQKTFYNIDFPRGHIAVKSFDVEVVDKGGNPVSLLETYLHHWHVIRYHERKGDIIFVKNKGLCSNHRLMQYFGLGSESRKTKTYLPDPYGIVVGNQAEIPDGYEERWMLDVHTIDTRGVNDILGCTECRCDLYNVTKDEYGKALGLSYKGGLSCCYHNTKCRLQEDFLDSVSSSTLFVKYTVKYVDWDISILPVEIYILDVTTTFKSSNESGGPSTYNCQVIEYDVQPCSASANKEDCIDSKTTSLSLPADGDVIFAVAHQHRGGIGSTLYGQDGSVLCSSFPVYGEGTEPGNEAGYIVGMSTCFPKPGSTKISAGESLTLVSNYSSAQMHTGVTGIFYLIVAEPKSGAATNASLYVPKKPRPSYVWFIMLPGVVAVMAIIIGYGKRCKKEGYTSLRI